MTYTRQSFLPTNTGSEDQVLTARQAGNLDRALFEQDARVTVLEAAVADLLARVIVLEGP